MKRLISFWMVGLLLSVFSLSGQAKEMTLSFDHYYDGDEMVEAVKTLHKKYGKLTELRPRRK